MKLFQCQACGQLLYFENTRCENCARRLGYRAEAAELFALDADGQDWYATGRPDRRVRFCANAALDACNWLLPADDGLGDYCLACRHNRTVPDLGVQRNLQLWRKLEGAKHRLFYTLIRLGLPLVTRANDTQHGLAFDFLAEPPNPASNSVVTGHDRGVITVSVEEADDAQRERMREAMGESYRTLLGHLRHEVGHWFWDVLVNSDMQRLAEFRSGFGDERQDYGAALQRHYDNGAPADWPSRFVSAYASAHPWEDWAETWAHYLHMVDTLETARAFGLSVRPGIARNDAAMTAEIDFDPHAAWPDIETLIGDWLPLTYAVNSLNRSMGQPDLYPFVLSAPAIAKLGFVHRLVHAPRHGS